MSQPRVTIRPALAQDVPAVTDLIHRAFQTWKQTGLRLSPMSQDEAQTAKHLLSRGFVAVDAAGTIVGTFSLSDWQFAGLRYLAFKKLAICPSVAKAGIGRLLYQTAEDIARAEGYPGMAIETVREADWLYRWYEKLGFVAADSCRYPGSLVDTILMIKRF